MHTLRRLNDPRALLRAVLARVARARGRRRRSPLPRGQGVARSGCARRSRSSCSCSRSSARPARRCPGQAIGPGRYLLALVATGWRQAAAAAERPDKLGLVLDSAPDASRDAPSLASPGRSDGAGGADRVARRVCCRSRLVEPDGLIVTTAGQYVRLIECQRVPNTITADGPLAMIERAFRELCRAIPDRQSLVVYAQTDPIPIDEALAEDREPASGRRATQDTPPATASSPRRAGGSWRGLTQTVFGAAGAQSSPPSPRAGGSPSPTSPPLRRRRASSCGTRRCVARRKTSCGSASRRGGREPAADRADPGRARAAPGSRPTSLDGVQTLALLWERIHPAAEPSSTSTSSPTAVRSPTRPAPRRPQQQRHRCSCRCATAPTRDRRRREPRARCATPTGRSRRSCISAPRRCRPARGGWRTCCRCPLPATLAVHITVGSRGREQGRQRRRWKRLRAAVLYKQRRGQLVGSDEQEALDEAAGRRRRARRRDRRDRLPGRDLLRDPRPARRAARVPTPRRQTAREFHALTNARVDPRPPAVPARVHRDAAARRRPAARDPQLRAAEHRALRPADLDQLRVAERADPRVRRPRRDGRADRPVRPALPTTRDAGRSARRAAGRRCLMNALLMRAIAQGMRGWIIDRSSTPDEHGKPPAPGHYDTLAVADPRLAARAGRLERRRRDLPVGRRTTPPACRARRSSSCSRCTRC